MQSIAKTFPTKAAVVAWSQKIEAQVAAGGWMYDPGAVTVGMMIERYVTMREEADREIFDKSSEGYTVKRLKVDFGERRIIDLTVDDLVAWCTTRRAEGAGSRSNARKEP
ncbi:MAG: hypothetical protein LBI92_03830 [Azoarcus sp.]|nr:hypothetical protein [Azoarcus sp.]